MPDKCVIQKHDVEELEVLPILKKEFLFITYMYIYVCMYDTYMVIPHFSQIPYL